MPGQGSTKMVSPTTVHSMAQQHHPGAYPENTGSDYRVELPSHVVLNGKDHKVALASLTYLTYGMWPMPSSTWLAFLPGHTHPPTSVNEEGKECDDNGDKRPMSPACRGTTFIRGWRTLFPATMIASGPSRMSWIAMTEQTHGHIQSDTRILAFRQWLVQCFRPGLQHCMTQVVLIWLLSLPLGWPDEERMLIRWGNTHFRAPSSPRLEAVDSLYVHCNLAADTHMVGSIKNLSSSMHTWL